MIQAVDRLPPHNLEAEQSVLGSLLIDRDAIIRVASFIRAADFYRAANALIFQAVLDLYNRREPPDLITLVDELRRNNRLDDAGGESYLSELIAAVPTAVHVEYYARIVERTAVLRRLIDAGTQIVGIGFDESQSVEDALDDAERLVFDVAQRRTTRDFQSIGEVLERYFDRLDTLHQNKGEVVGVPTGYADLDKLTGGLQKSDLIIIAARPAVGKSALGLGFAYNAAVRYGRTVGLFVLEMSAEQIVQRILSMETGIDSHRLRLGYIDDSEWSSVTRAFGRLSESAIYVDDTASINIMELRSKARRLHAERGLDLLIVDYLQLVTGRRTENRVQEISEISRSLKGLARELDVPVVALAQLSRAVESRQSHVPMLSDLRESGCLTGDTLVADPQTGLATRIDCLIAHSDARVWAIDQQGAVGDYAVSNAFSTGMKPVFELRLASGRKIAATANHPFRTPAGWTALRDLQRGDLLAAGRTSPAQAPRSNVHTHASAPTAVHLLRNAQSIASSTMEIIWDRVVSIEPAGMERVYDLTVPGAHNFLANGIFVHNSIEQDADIVAFIYREDVYDQETDRKGIADLIIAKHRNGPVGTVHLRFFDRTARFADLELYREPDL